MSGLHDAFYVSAAMAFVAAIASLLRGERYIHGQQRERMTAALRAALHPLEGMATSGSLGSVRAAPPLGVRAGLGG